jgi:hypothetical protein
MGGQWLTQQTADDVVHAIPLDDEIVHDHADTCPCGPTARPTPMRGDATGWIVTHHSLDGRELDEPDYRQAGGDDA